MKHLLPALLCAAFLMSPPNGNMQAPLNKWIVVNSFADMRQCNPDYPAETKAPGAPPGFAWDNLCVCTDDPRLAEAPTALRQLELPHR